MTDKEKKSKIADILMDFQEEYSNEVINRPMLASLYAGNILSFIDSLQEEPVNENLDKAAIKFSKGWAEWDYASACFKAGAEWQKDQLEKNRLHHCETLTEEQAKIESHFVVQHMKNNNRPLTCIDAIEYGMRLHKEQMMAKAEKVEVSCASFAPLSSGNYKAGDKLLIIKEEEL